MRVLRGLLGDQGDGVYSDTFHPGQAADGEPRPDRPGYVWYDTGLRGFAKWVQVPASATNGVTQSDRAWQRDSNWFTRTQRNLGSALDIATTNEDGYWGKVFSTARGFWKNALGDDPSKPGLPWWVVPAAAAAGLLIVLKK